MSNDSILEVVGSVIAIGVLIALGWVAGKNLMYNRVVECLNTDQCELTVNQLKELRGGDNNLGEED